MVTWEKHGVLDWRKRDVPSVHPGFIFQWSMDIDNGGGDSWRRIVCHCLLDWASAIFGATHRIFPLDISNTNRKRCHRGPKRKRVTKIQCGLPSWSGWRYGGGRPRSTLFDGHFVQSIVHPMMAHRTSVWPLLADGHPFFRGHRDISDVLNLLSVPYFCMFWPPPSLMWKENLANLPF